MIAGLLVGVIVFSQSSYVKKYRPLANELSEEYGIPVSVILGVAIHESGAGTSQHAKLLNNHFGIKGKNKLLKEKGIRSSYKQYDEVKDCYKDFCKIIKKKKFYNNLKGNKDYKLWVDAISKAGYSVIPETWKGRILNTIRKNKLYLYDGDPSALKRKSYSSFLNLATGMFNCSLYLATVRRAIL